MDNTSKTRLLTVAIATVIVLSILYFIPVPIPYKKEFPMLSLFGFGFVLQSWPIIIAALFSMIGDLFGDLHNMPLQMASFAVAHFFYIGYFLARGLRLKKKGGVSGTWFAICTVSAVAVYFLCVEKVIPFAPEGVLRTGFYIYGAIVVTMMWSALMQKDWYWGVGGVLFVLSDSLIAINGFVTPVPHERLLIMSTYYAAQILIFYRAALEHNGWKQ